MKKKISKEDSTVILSDRYVSESGVQGGKIIAEHIVIGSLIVGIPLFIMGVLGLLLVFGVGSLAAHAANSILFLLLSVIGLVLSIGGYFVYKDKQGRT